MVHLYLASVSSLRHAPGGRLPAVSIYRSILVVSLIFSFTYFFEWLAFPFLAMEIFRLRGGIVGNALHQSQIRIEE
jgi:hypothetical protein